MTIMLLLILKSRILVRMFHWLTGTLWKNCARTVKSRRATTFEWPTTAQTWVRIKLWDLWRQLYWHFYFKIRQRGYHNRFLWVDWRHTPEGPCTTPVATRATVNIIIFILMPECNDWGIYVSNFRAASGLHHQLQAKENDRAGEGKGRQIAKLLLNPMTYVLIISELWSWEIRCNRRE